MRAVVFFILVFVERKECSRGKTDLCETNEGTSTMQTPDYSSMYLADLKLIAKTRRIKMYYIKSKEELVNLLNMPELPQAMKVEKMTIRELRQEAKARGVPSIWGRRRGDLVNILFPENLQQTTPNENNQDERKAHEHHQPEEHDPK
jgi:hypothetical protein